MSVQQGKAATAHASRYLQQLAKHWAHKNEVTFDAEHADILLRGNRVTMHAEADALLVTLEAGPDADPMQLRTVFEEHINRFAFREAPLPFEWTVI